MYYLRNYLIHLPKLCRHIKRINHGYIKGERDFHKTAATNKKDPKNENNMIGSAASKYEVFTDEDSLIFDIGQEREKFYEINDEMTKQDRKKADFLGISPERGITGVIEIKELIEILKRENAFDIFVVEVPKVYCYVDYMVLACGKSKRHMNAIAEFVRKVYKYKTSAVEGIPVIEGKDSKDWIALDLENIALHIMSQSARKYYDLESLWSLDRNFDLLSNMKETNQELSYESIFPSLMPSA